MFYATFSTFWTHQRLVSVDTFAFFLLVHETQHSPPPMCTVFNWNNKVLRVAYERRDFYWLSFSDAFSHSSLQLCYSFLSIIMSGFIEACHSCRIQLLPLFLFSRFTSLRSPVAPLTLCSLQLHNKITLNLLSWKLIPI